MSRKIGFQNYLSINDFDLKRERELLFIVVEYYLIEFIDLLVRNPSISQIQIY